MLRTVKKEIVAYSYSIHILSGSESAPLKCSRNIAQRTFVYFNTAVALRIIEISSVTKQHKFRTKVLVQYRSVLHEGNCVYV